MREDPRLEARTERNGLDVHRPGSEMERRFPIALALYAVLAALAWFTLGEGTIFVGGRPVEIRMLPLVVLGGFALRTVVARQAEKIRRESK